jgi:hypothetical protein
VPSRLENCKCLLARQDGSAYATYLEVCLHLWLSSSNCYCIVSRGWFAGTFMASTFFCARTTRAHQRRQVLLSVPSTLGPVLAEGRRAEKGDAQIIHDSTRQHRHLRSALKQTPASRLTHAPAPASSGPPRTVNLQLHPPPGTPLAKLAPSDPNTKHQPARRTNAMADTLSPIGIANVRLSHLETMRSSC